MRLLDLFCGAGGAGVGYARAGFTVVGVDNRPQPNYPFVFVQADALEALAALTSGAELSGWRLGDFAAVHASPPCQRYSSLAAMHPGRSYPDLLDRTRQLVRAAGLPYVIENVERAPMAHHPQLDGVWGIVLCGSMFGLGVTRGQLRRHRAFESSVPLEQPACRHRGRAVGVYGHGGNTRKPRMLHAPEAREAMEMDWANRDELAQAIPPAYTEFIGAQLCEVLA